jgi:Carbohydrate binding module (family 6).
MAAFDLIRPQAGKGIAVSDVAALRALDVSGYNEYDAVIVSDYGVVVRWFPGNVWDENEEAGVIRPNSIAQGSPGRWRCLDEQVPPAQVSSVIRIEEIEANNGGAVWPTSPTQLGARDLEVSDAVVEGTALVQLALNGQFTTSGTRAAQAELRAGSTPLVNVDLVSAANGQTTYTERTVKVPLTPGTKALTLWGQAGAGFIGEARLVLRLYSIKL